MPTEDCPNVLNTRVVNKFTGKKIHDTLRADDDFVHIKIRPDASCYKPSSEFTLRLPDANTLEQGRVFEVKFDKPAHLFTKLVLARTQEENLINGDDENVIFPRAGLVKLIVVQDVDECGKFKKGTNRDCCSLENHWCVCFTECGLGGCIRKENENYTVNGHEDTIQLTSYASTDDNKTFVLSLPEDLSFITKPIRLYLKALVKGDGSSNGNAKVEVRDHKGELVYVNNDYPSNMDSAAVGVEQNGPATGDLTYLPTGYEIIYTLTYDCVDGIIILYGGERIINSLVVEP